MEDTVRHSRVAVSGLGPSNTPGIVQIDRHLSQLNRRLYRQGRTYTVKVDLDAGAVTGTNYQVYTLANTWMLKKAWQLAKEEYDDEMMEVAKTFKGKTARWRDFRLDLNPAYTGALALDTHLIDVNGNEVPLLSGEYIPSTVRDDAGASFTWGIENGSANRFNILIEFDRAGRADTDPEIPQASVAYDQLNTDIQDGDVLEITGNGNEPPYAQNNSNGSNPLTYVGELYSDSFGQKLSTGYFDAPLGLVIIVGTAVHKLSGNTELTVVCKKGDYKGVHATSLME